MEQQKTIALLKQNFDTVEAKHQEFFAQGEPRWPGEPRDYLRNHHTNLSQLPINRLNFESLQLNGLPEPIMNDLSQAFSAYEKGEVY